MRAFAVITTLITLAAYVIIFMAFRGSL